ncbi:hypothetical protein ACA910_009633 [Epithemia clementina (nom. ined.)]
MTKHHRLFGGAMMALLAALYRVCHSSSNSHEEEGAVATINDESSATLSCLAAESSEAKVVGDESQQQQEQLCVEEEEAATSTSSRTTTRILTKTENEISSATIKESSPSSSASSSFQIKYIGEDPFQSPVLIFENFLDEALVRSTVDTLLQQQENQLNHGWRPVIPRHQKYYQEQRRKQSQDNGDGKEGNQRFLLQTPPERSGGFPGLRHNLFSDDDYSRALKQKLESLDLEATYFGNASSSSSSSSSLLTLDWSSTDSFFGNVCYHPQKSLSVAQRVPHTDMGLVVHPSSSSGNRNHRPGRLIQLAVVHYMNPQFAGTGGTGFFQERSSGGNRFRLSDCHRLKQRAEQDLGVKMGTTAFVQAASCHCHWGKQHCHDYLWYEKMVKSLSRDPSDNNNNNTSSNDLGDHSGYLTGSTPLYKLLLHVPYRFNTAVIYDARQLHAPLIDADTLQHLSCNATTGRLTANLFLS